MRERIQGAIALLASEPDRRRPASSKTPGTARASRDYRIICTIQDDLLLIVVIPVGHRRDVCDR
jgi:mRNA interferase RelE/StbE